MFFFISLKKIEKYVEEYFSEIVKQYGLIEMPATLENVIENLNSVQNELNKSVNNIKTLERNYIVDSEKINQAFQVYDSNFRDFDARLTRIEKINLDNDNKNLQILSLKKELNEEKESNAKLLKMVKKQEADILKLEALVREIQDKILYQKQESNEPVVEDISKPVSIIVIFSDNIEKNKKALNCFIVQTQKLREEVEKLFDNSEALELYLKLIDKCLKKFESLSEKFLEKQYSSDKLANESAKILKQTIVRAMSQEVLKSYMDKYMKACGVRKLNWKIGKQIADEDYDYIDEPIFYDNISDISLNNTITAIIQDTFIIDYQEDNNQYEAVIPGIYKIGKYKN